MFPGLFFSYVERASGTVQLGAASGFCCTMADIQAESTWVGIIANPGSGRGQGLKRVELLEAALVARGVRVQQALTPDGRKKLIGVAADQPESRKYLVAIGGDGTVNAVVNEHPTVPFCNFASGTENLFAKAFQTPREAEELAEWLLRAEPRQMDLGEFTVQQSAEASLSRRFALMLGFGFDAAVVSRHHAKRTATTGHARPTSRLDYFWPLAHEAWNYKFPNIRLSWMDEAGTRQEQVGSTVILFNMDCYALGLRFTPQATAFDHNLDSICFSRKGAIQAGLYFATVCLGTHPGMKSVSLAQMKEVVVEALEQPVPVQMDGDPAGMLEPGHPWLVKCLPAACPVLFNS